MPVFWLSPEDVVFPHPELANQDGILAVGGDLSEERLLLAYQSGLFPWFNPEDPIIWWSPDPRFVLYPKNLKVSKSMRPYFNQRKFRVTFDRDFTAVIKACQQQRRRGQGGGTWITDEMLDAYIKLHRLGYAHSVEVWEDSEMVGGLYGISIGKVFFGESMFTRVSNASKVGFITLVTELEKRGFWLIDCQQETNHLASLGAETISRKEFLALLEKNKEERTLKGNWSGFLGQK